MEALLPLLPEWLGAVAVLMLASISPRFKRPPLVFKYARRDGLFALGVWGVALVVAVILALVNLSGFLPGFGAALQPVTSRLVLALVCVLPAIGLLLQRQQPWRSAGWNRAMQMPALQLGLALGFLAIFLRGKFNSLFTGMGVDALNALWMWLVIALAEETLFRGYIQLRLTTWWGARWGWLGTAGLFLLWQLPRWLMMPEQLLVNLLIGAAQALLCGWIMRQSGHVAASALYRAISEWLFFIV